MHAKIKLRINFGQSVESEMQVKGTRLWCMHVEYAKDNNYARFYDPSYHRYSERHLSVLPIKKSDKVHGA